MRQATGEANMTIVIIVLATIILAIGTIIVTNVMNNTKNAAACDACGGVWKGGKCHNPAKTSKFIDYRGCMNVKT